MEVFEGCGPIQLFAPGRISCESGISLKNLKQVWKSHKSEVIGG